MALYDDDDEYKEKILPIEGIFLFFSLIHSLLSFINIFSAHSDGDIMLKSVALCFLQFLSI